MNDVENIKEKVQEKWRDKLLENPSSEVFAQAYDEQYKGVPKKIKNRSHVNT